VPRPSKTDPQVFWLTVAGAVVLAVFVAFCWLGSYHPDLLPKCRGGTMKSVAVC
jgi:hypothetical protein